MKCPNCVQDIHDDAKTCHYCGGSTTRFKSQLDLMKKNLGSHTRSHFDFAVMLLIICAPLLLLFVPRIAFLGPIMSLLFILCFARPFYMNPSVLVSVVALLFVAAGFFVQQNDFEMRNRPYLQIVDERMQINATGRYRLTDSKEPQPEFEYTYVINNHGPIPASVTGISAFGFNLNQNDLSETSLTQMNPDSSDQTKQWINLDVFPYSTGEVSNVEPRQKKFYWSIQDVKRVFGISLEREEILATKYVDDLFSSRSRYLDDVLVNKIPSFNLIMCLDYYALGEQSDRDKRYEYWTWFKYYGDHFEYYRSGLEGACPASIPSLPKVHFFKSLYLSEWDDVFLSFCISLIASLIAVLIALSIERFRMPLLEISFGDEANASNTYPQMGSWRFVRILVRNKKMPWLLRWIPRQTAENCRASIEFFKEVGDSICSMPGRWASTPEIPNIPPDSIRMRVLHPDPVTIPVGNQEFLDVVAQNQDDRCAYGWNNEAYLHNWRNPRTRLEPGRYRIKVVVNSQNGISKTKMLILHVNANYSDTKISG